jgi:hypothetical protein
MSIESRSKTSIRSASRLKLLETSRISTRAMIRSLC